MTRTLTLVGLALVLGCNRNKDENPDMDGDGYKQKQDCDDSNAEINPDAAEICDGLDNDCDDETDEDAEDASTFYADSDGDGYGNPLYVIDVCNQPYGYILYSAGDEVDCNDNDFEVRPNPPVEEESCNGKLDRCENQWSTRLAHADGSARTGHPLGQALCGDVDGLAEPIPPESKNSDHEVVALPQTNTVADGGIAVGTGILRGRQNDDPKITGLASNHQPVEHPW